MEWSPITHAALEKLIAADLEEMDDTVQVAWHSMRIQPQKWQCSPWGDGGGGFWAVAIKSDQVVWYNDIEDGFNTSPFTRWGTIDAYSCSEANLADFLLSLPEAKAAESSSDCLSATAVPSDLQHGGTIVRRQTTYWELLSTKGRLWRLHFKSRAEVRFDKPLFSHIELADAHPILDRYLQPWLQLYYMGSLSDAEKFKRLLAERIATASNSWRSINEYLKPSVDLGKSYGMLTCAPVSIVTVASSLLNEMGVRTSTLRHTVAREHQRALIMDKSFLVAQAFWFEERSTEK